MAPDLCTSNGCPTVASKSKYNFSPLLLMATKIAKVNKLSGVSEAVPVDAHRFLPACPCPTGGQLHCFGSHRWQQLAVNAVWAGSSLGSPHPGLLYVFDSSGWEKVAFWVLLLSWIVFQRCLPGCVSRVKVHPAGRPQCPLASRAAQRSRYRQPRPPALVLQRDVPGSCRALR